MKHGDWKKECVRFAAILILFVVHGHLLFHDSFEENKKDLIVESFERITTFCENFVIVFSPLDGFGIKLGE